MLLTNRDYRELLGYFPCDNHDVRKVAKAQHKKVVEHIEKYVFYMDTRGYIALKPNATTNWQALLKEVK